MKPHEVTMFHDSKHSPFWDVGYSQYDVSCMGGPSLEVYEIAPILAPTSTVVELGCGEGRNALYLAHFGHKVIASDLSKAAISKVSLLAETLNVNISADVGAVENFICPPLLDVFIAQTVLHFTDRSVWQPIIKKAIQNTRPGGIHCFTNFLDEAGFGIPLEILACGHKKSFSKNELKKIYVDAGWEVLRSDHYVKWDSHPGIPIHSHYTEKLVVRKPTDRDANLTLEAEPIQAAGRIDQDLFDRIQLGTSRADVIEMCGEPDATHGMRISQKAVGGNNQDAIVDGYELEDLFYGDRALQIVNGRLTGKYLYFSTPQRIVTRAVSE